MKKKVAVAMLYGGRSVEHEISIRSARNVYAHIDRDRFDVMLIGIDKSGRWHMLSDFGVPIEEGSPLQIQLDPQRPALMSSTGKEIFIPDVALPILHGTDGEDGSIQGLFAAMNVPVVGSGVLGSAISLDKVISKQILAAAGIPVAGFLEFRRHQLTGIAYGEVVEKLGLPFMVKSASLGSSVGVSKVRNEKEFSSAIAESFRFDDKIVLEEFIQGRELECAVIGNERPESTLPGEIIMVKAYDFYDYAAKYLDGDAVQIKIPADVDPGTSAIIKDTAVRAYRALQCEDYARVDLFLCPDGRVVINEINTIPGFTDVSMFPMLWKHMGLSYGQLISRLIDAARDRWELRRIRQTDYDA